MELCHRCHIPFEREHIKIRTESNQVFHKICSQKYTLEPQNIITVAIMMHTLKIQQLFFICLFLKRTIQNLPLPKSNNLLIPYLDLTTRTSIKREYKKWKTIYYELTGKHFYKIRSTSYF
uniref:Uncharacterized protein n=1 Tax=viral metagenome TaxID=1070528 RepID=A0A6C0HFF4_9ZZZZ